MRFLSLLISFSLLACSETEDNKKPSSVDEQEVDVVEAKKELKDSLSIFKSQYITLYQSKLVASNAHDSIQSHLEELNTVFLNTADFIDSVWSYVDTMDYRTESNILLMRNKFVEEGLGETLYHKMNLVFERVKRVAPHSAYPVIEEQHTAIFNNQDAKSWRRKYFWLINPLGVNILLYGFQSALYKASYQSLSN